MRTTIRLDDELLDAAKRYALENGKSFTSVVQDALREKLIGRSKTKSRAHVKLKTVGGNGLCAGVDIDDFASLLDAMDC